MITKSYEIKNKPTNFLKYNLFLLYGENFGLKKEIKELIKATLDKQDNNIEILTLFERDVIDNEESFYDSIYSGSLFGNKKIIIIYEGTDKIFGKIEDITNKYPDNVILIILSDILEKKSKLRIFFEAHEKALCIPCYADNERDLKSIATVELKQSNIILSNESINLLVDKANSDRNNLKNEIQKIKSFALNKKSLSTDEIKSIINFTGEYKSNSFINECLCGNLLQYKKILSELHENTVDQIYLLRILGNKIHKLLNMKKIERDYSNLDALLNATKPPIFWKEKPFVKKQLTIWSLDELKKIVNEINITELLCKKNPQTSKIIFFNFFSKLCKKANNYS